MRLRNIIIGAGISGLALGWFLKKRFGKEQDLLILEASERPGGWIRSPCDQGFLFERGPRSCRSRGAGLATLHLIEELGLCKEVISANLQAQKRFLYLDGKLQQVPQTLLGCLFSPLMKGVLPALWKEWQVPSADLEDESIASFIDRRLNKSIAERLVDPLVSGIYAGDIHKLSLRSCFPEIHRLEQEHGSLVKGMLCKKKNEPDSSHFIETQRNSPMFSFKKGMETLVIALYNQLKEGVRLASCAKTLSCEKEHILVGLENGECLKGDRVFLAIPASATAQIIKNVASFSAKKMSRIPSATVGVVNMGWNKKVLKQEGFGYLVPSSQKQSLLGMVFDSSAFAEQNESVNQTRLTAMVGGRHHPEVEYFSNKKFIGIVTNALNRHLGIFSEPEKIEVFIAKEAIPQYEVGHHNMVLEIEKELKLISQSRLYLLGSAWQGVAVNDCIVGAKKVVDSLSLLYK